MTSRSFDETQVMFTLAMLGYRGLQVPGEGVLHDLWLRGAVQDGLDELAPLRGDWEVAWGPATYRAPFTLFDDSAAYVARSLERPGRYVVSVRGTNPFSLFDWVFGDLWTAETTPWRHGDPARPSGARLSLSTALGLEILCDLRGTRPASGPLGFVEHGVADHLLGPLDRLYRGVARPVEAVLDVVSEQLRGSLLRDLGHLAELHDREPLAWCDADHDDGELQDRVRAVQDLRGSESWQRARAHLIRVLGSRERPPELLSLLEGASWLSNQLRVGETLLSFLSGATREARRGQHPLEVFVTGHSKGGALAPTLALFLAETQGKSYPPKSMRWNPEGDARIHCYAFAGPTPGNGAFARRFDAVLGDRGHRISNVLDVVPHAWAVPTRESTPSLHLRQVPSLYDPDGKPSPLLEVLVDVVADEVADLDYQHPGTRVLEFQEPLEPGRPLFAELLDQHVEAYIRGLGLADSLSLLDLFGTL